MRGLRKIAKAKKPGRRFPDREDAAHLERVRGMACLLRGRRCVITRWQGVYPDVQEVSATYTHVCGGSVEAHHVLFKSQGGSDLDCVPLCSVAHGDFHTLGQPAFEERWNLDLAREASRLSPNTMKENDTP